MHAHSLLRQLLTPSVLSAAATVCAVLATLGYTAWVYVSEQQALYEYLFGPYGLKTYLWQQTAQASSFMRAFLGSSAPAYYLLVGGAAVAAGVVVYMGLQAASLLSNIGGDVWRELRAKGASRSAVIWELAARALLRAVALVGWGLFAAFFVTTLVPFAAVLNQLGVQTVLGHRPLGVFACLGAAALLLLSLHMHVVFLRLVCLRVRLFGGAEPV